MQSTDCILNDKSKQQKREGKANVMTIRLGHASRNESRHEKMKQAQRREIGR